MIGAAVLIHDEMNVAAPAGFTPATDEALARRPVEMPSGRFWKDLDNGRRVHFGVTFGATPCVLHVYYVTVECN